MWLIRDGRRCRPRTNGASRHRLSTRPSAARPRAIGAFVHILALLAKYTVQDEDIQSNVNVSEEPAPDSEQHAKVIMGEIVFEEGE